MVHLILPQNCPGLFHWVTTMASRNQVPRLGAGLGLLAIDPLAFAGQPRKSPSSRSVNGLRRRLSGALVDRLRYRRRHSNFAGDLEAGFIAASHRPLASSAFLGRIRAPLVGPVHYVVYLGRSVTGSSDSFSFFTILVWVFSALDGSLFVDRICSFSFIKRTNSLAFFRGFDLW